MSRNTRFTALGLIMILSLVLGALVVQPIAAQGDALAACDPTVRALVWAARDAYGYDWTVGGGMTGGATGGQDTTGDTGDAEATPEATDSAKLTTMKVSPVIQQDATPEATAEAGDDNGGEDTTQAQQPAAPTVNCDAIRADVVAFVFAQNNVSMDGGQAGGMTFTVNGVAYTPNFHVLMSGPQEVPGPGDADGQGEAWLWIDSASNTVCWSMVTAGIAIPASAAHIHPGAEGESGPPVVPLTAPGADGASAGCTNEAEPGVIDAILANSPGYYVNVHTNEHPDGAIRGQLLGAGS